MPVKKIDHPPMDDAEWAAQERGMRGASGPGEHGLSGADAAYREVADALASMPRSEPPADFASDVVKCLAQRESGLERALSRLLLAAFVVAAAVLGALNFAPGLQLLRASFSEEGLGWIVLGAGCVGLSWATRRAREISAPPSAT